jgi:hypothetical protein
MKKCNKYCSCDKDDKNNSCMIYETHKSINRLTYETHKLHEMYKNTNNESISKDTSIKILMELTSSDVVEIIINKLNYFNIKEYDIFDKLTIYITFPSNEILQKFNNCCIKKYIKDYNEIEL